MRAARRRVYHADPAQEADYNREYRRVNSDAVRQRKADDYRNNVIREKLRRGKNRAIKAGIPADDITVAELLSDWERRVIDPTRCVYTGEQLQDGWHIDHAVPLSHPNTPGHVVANLVPCNPKVNVAKWRRHWIDFLADRAVAERV
ncbi:HNH endonuclease [Mycobacterium sp. DL592]|uniref:HNH endonuclease signature motif containing protein n=1 Tax=Mycobacterium sp. DL592 TaxID=2675524 RepID=UPI001421A437|nr:HNH endonuclease [Mycobacterium sp. DL592]